MQRALVLALIVPVLLSAAAIAQTENPRTLPPSIDDPAAVRQALLDLVSRAENDPIKLYGLYEQAVRWTKRYEQIAPQTNPNPGAARDGLYNLIDEALREGDDAKLIGLYRGAKRVSDWVDARRRAEASRDNGDLQSAWSAFADPFGIMSGGGFLDEHCEQCQQIETDGSNACVDEHLYQTTPEQFEACMADVERAFCLCDGPPSSMVPNHRCHPYYG